MKVGVVVSGLRSTIGGGYTFQQNIVTALISAETVHEFIVLDQGDGQDDPTVDIPRINLKARYHPAVEPTASPWVDLKDRWLPKRLKQRLAPAYRRLRATFTLLKPTRSQASETAVKDDLARAAEDFELDLLWFLSPNFTNAPVPFILTVWDLQHRVQPWFPEVSVKGWNWEAREHLYSTMIPRATLVVTGTEAGRQEVIHYYAPNPGNVRVIPFPTPEYVYEAVSISDQQVLSQYQLAPGYLFYPAQFWPHKNHVNLLRALALLRDQHAIDLEVVFVGSDHGNQAHVQEVAERLGIKPRFLGFVPNEAMPALYRQASALVFPSFFGPDNLPPLEAFALGCPVVAADVQGAAEQLGDAAIRVNPARPLDIANGILRVVKNEGSVKRLTEKGHEIADLRTGAEYIITILRFFDEFQAVDECWV